MLIMFTSRGWWFLLIVVLLFAGGVLGQYVVNFIFPRQSWQLPHVDTVSLMALTLLLWFAWEWLLFTVHSRLVIRRVRFTRHIHDERGPVFALWAGRVFKVHLQVELTGRTPIPYLVLADRLPMGVKRARGEARYEGELNSEEPVEIMYPLHCPGVGYLRFEGLSLQMADLHGFFYHTTFLARPAVYPVLPALAEARHHGPTVKRHNLLLPPGIHRHRRPGSGSELLDLRDYMPGDPPKTIAWKVSARRDRLITKEFESEVPVRCTLFVDRSSSVRLGPPGQNALARLVEIAAAVAQVATENRDLTGLCLFDEETSTVVRPARGSRHLVHILNLLADAAGLAPASGQAKVNTLMPLAYSVAQEIYPDQMRSELNRFPGWLAWLWPPPASLRQKPAAADYFFRWLPFLLPLYAGIGLILLGLGFVAAAIFLRNRNLSSIRVLIVLALGTFASIMLLLRIPGTFFFPRRRRWLRWRKQLAALLSVRSGLAPGGLALLLEDDQRFARYLQRFLTEHEIPYPLVLYDRNGHYLFAAPGKVKVLASALLRAVGKGHDNELLVLLVDLLELADEIGPLLRAVKVALARHHRVMLVCPWPPGIEVPHRIAGNHTSTAKGMAADSSTILANSSAVPKAIQEAVLQTTTKRFHRAFHHVRRTFARLGVPVVCAQSGDPARLILDKLDLLRELRRKK
jgi:uncharacterized protein (DUF58 family)